MSVRDRLGKDWAGKQPQKGKEEGSDLNMELGEADETVMVLSAPQGT